MLTFYSPAEAERLSRRSRISLFTACALLLLALAVCVALCCRVNTGNAQTMLYAVIGTFTLAGWAAIVLLRLAWAPSAARYRHVKSILTGETVELEGTLRLTSAFFQIPKGIAVRKAVLEDGEETRSLNVDARLVKQLPPDGTRVRVRVVRKFITAVEELPCKP